MRRITVIGTGYVGLVTGAALARLGHHVTCLDIDRDKIAALKKGIIPFFEPGLEQLVAKGREADRLHFTTDYAKALENSTICFFALPTPSNPDESCNLHFLQKAAKQSAQHLHQPMLFVIKSTVPVGTAEHIKKTIQKELSERGLSLPFDVVSNPEFLREGGAVKDCLDPDRILVGTNNPDSITQMQELYSPYLDRIIVMDIRSAELAKYGANMMLATRISLINELAGLCEKLGADIDKVAYAMGADERIGASYLQAGIGFGGSCLPKDVKALRSIARAHGHPSTFFDCILEINERQRVHFLQKILSYYTSVKEKKLAIWGLAFKPGTDDMREAPSLFIIQKLLANGAKLHLFDPAVTNKHNPLVDHKEVSYFSDPLEAAKGVDGLIILTEWELFQEINLSILASLMGEKVIFDGRNQYTPSLMQKNQFQYFSMGKPPIEAMVLV